MRTPSTATPPSPPADRKRPDGDSRSEPEVDAADKRSSTRAAVKGKSAPRLPHERDESSDSGTSPPREVMRQAAKDLESGKTSTDRGEVTDELYERTLRGSR